MAIPAGAPQSSFFNGLERGGKRVPAVAFREFSPNCFPPTRHGYKRTTAQVHCPWRGLSPDLLRCLSRCLIALPLGATMSRTSRLRNQLNLSGRVLTGDKRHARCPNSTIQGERLHGPGATPRSGHRLPIGGAPGPSLGRMRRALRAASTSIVREWGKPSNPPLWGRIHPRSPKAKPSLLAARGWALGSIDAAEKRSIPAY